MCGYNEANDPVTNGSKPLRSCPVVWVNAASGEAVTPVAGTSVPVYGRMSQT